MKKPVPSTRAQDGTLIYFIEHGQDGGLTFEHDFVMERAKTGAKTLAFRIGLVVHILPDDTMDASVLFFCAMLNPAPEPAMIMADPSCPSRGVFLRIRAADQWLRPLRRLERRYAHGCIGAIAPLSQSRTLTTPINRPTGHRGREP